MSSTGTPILFPPPRVKAVLAYMPTVATLIPNPEDEGVESEAFPGVLRKTDRELYRWIANPHYEHLLEPIAQLEQVYGAGCRFDRLLTTTSRELFVSLRTEAFVAHDLLRRGYEVETIERSDGPTPDLRVRGDGIDMAVEVYSPRELRAVADWTHDVSDLMQYVDVGASFDSNVSTSVERPIPPEGVTPDPWAHDGMLEQTRTAVLSEISHDVEDALGNLRSFEKSYPHLGTPMTTTVTLDNVRAAPAAGPVRSGSFSYPGFSGYSPAGVFRTIVERAAKKARRRQTKSSDATTRALVVYLMETQVAEDLIHPAHAKGAESVLENIDVTEYGLDVIAFVVRALPRGLAYIFMVGDDAHLTRSQLDALFAERP